MDKDMDKGWNRVTLYGHKDTPGERASFSLIVGDEGRAKVIDGRCTPMEATWKLVGVTNAFLRLLRLGGEVAEPEPASENDLVACGAECVAVLNRIETDLPVSWEWDEEGDFVVRVLCFCGWCEKDSYIHFY